MSTTQPEFTMSQYASKDDMIGAMRQHIAELESRVQELGQMARDANSRRVIELEAELAAMRAGGEPVANSRPSLEAVFRGLSDRAYCNYIEQMRRDVCLGWEHKAAHGKFGEPELKGHVLAAQQLGRHKAFSEAANALRGSDAPLTQPAAQDAENAKNAARYKFLRDSEWRDTDLEAFIRLQLNALWDVKIDAAIAAQGENKNMSERAFHTTGYITPAQPISKDERALRRLLCAKYEHLPYMDDGEAHGQTLDWLRGSVEEIETRIREINIESFAAQSDAHMQMASPIFALAVQALNGVKAWRDCEGNDGFPDEVREQIDAVLSAFELRYTTHPITGEPMGTDAQEATAWRLKAEEPGAGECGAADGERHHGIKGGQHGTDI